MTDLDLLVRRQYVARQLLVRRSVLASKRLWAEIDPDHIRATWHGRVGPQMTEMVTAAQTEAASHADRNITTALETQDVDPEQSGAVHPEAFAGRASDGRDLAALLELSNVYALQQIGLGATPKQGLAFAGRWLAGTVGTQVQDAARVAQGVSITVSNRPVGYIREPSGSCCSRCAILAGRWYRWDAGFARHKSCKCTQVPATSEGGSRLVKDPQRLFREGRITDLSAADTKAIRDGADISRVVNAHRGMYTAGGRSFTYELKAYRASGRRPTPEQIYRDATSRSQAVDLLHRFGYIT